MSLLERQQHAIMMALDEGPAWLSDDLFTGGHLAVIRGMKVHANTISHARLVALEETFPRTRALLGHDRFNEHSRRFTGLPGVSARPLARIGKDFPAFLGDAGEPCVVPDLALFEWLWLEAYHAPEAVPLALTSLAGMAESALLEIEIAAHPAARIVRPDRGVFRLIGEEVPGLAEADAILIARPDADVLVSMATAAMASLIAALTFPANIGNLFASLTEPGCKDRLPPDDFMPALVALLEAGAVTSSGPLLLAGQQEG